MSEPIPEAIPTSADPRSRRPLKRARGANTAVATQANAIENLMFDPERPVAIPAATTSLSKSSLAPPPEIVANVQGSSAGAGSGEFHVYKASRRREYERLRTMDEEAKKEEEDEKWELEERERRERDEEKTRKNREKRNKKKAKKGGKENAGQHPDGSGGEENTNRVRKPLEVPRRGGEEEANQNAADVAESGKENGVIIHEDD